MVDLSKSSESVSKEKILDMKSRVDKFISNGGIAKDSRKIYIDFSTKTNYVTYSQYLNIIERWNSLGQPKSVPIYVAPVNISDDDKIIPISTFLDMETRVNRYLSQGGVIASNRAIFLSMGELKEYVTYTKYVDMLNRVEIFRKKNNRDPNFIYLQVKTNVNNSRPNAVGDNIVPNSDGWYLSPKYKSNASAIRQETLYWCADNAIQQAWYELTGNWYSESYIARIAGTTTSGTGHSGIEKALKTLAEKENKTININWDYLSDLGYEKFGKLIKSTKVGTFQHSNYKLRWGHYEYIVGINLETNKVLVANSLSGGWFEYRTFKTNTKYVNGCSQKSVCEILI